MKHSSLSIFNSPGKRLGCSSVAVPVHPNHTCCGTTSTSAPCLYWYKPAVLARKKVSQRSNLAQNCISSLGNHTDTNAQEKAEACSQQRRGSKALASMDFRLYFHGDLLGWRCSLKQPCPLPQCLFSCLQHAKCLCRHAIDLKNPHKTTRQPPTPQTH